MGAGCRFGNLAARAKMSGLPGEDNLLLYDFEGQGIPSPQIAKALRVSASTVNRQARLGLIPGLVEIPCGCHDYHCRFEPYIIIPFLRQKTGLNYRYKTIIPVSKKVMK